MWNGETDEERAHRELADEIELALGCIQITENDLGVTELTGVRSAASLLADIFLRLATPKAMMEG